jgi:hypothetical protein
MIRISLISPNNHSRQCQHNPLSQPPLFRYNPLSQPPLFRHNLFRQPPFRHNQYRHRRQEVPIRGRVSHSLVITMYPHHL